MRRWASIIFSWHSKTSVKFHIEWFFLLLLNLPISCILRFIGSHFLVVIFLEYGLLAKRPWKYVLSFTQKCSAGSIQDGGFSVLKLEPSGLARIRTPILYKNTELGHPSYRWQTLKFRCHCHVVFSYKGCELLVFLLGFAVRL